MPETHLFYRYFNRHIFALEQLEYEREGIPWNEIEFVDNGACLDLIERNMGVISLIDEESKMRTGTDESLLLKMHKACTEQSAEASNFYIKPRVANGKFGIRHYAGEVMYVATVLVCPYLSVCLLLGLVAWAMSPSPPLPPPQPSSSSPPPHIRFISLHLSGFH